MRIALVNLKGGVGKTTSSAFIAAELAKRGKTLVVDADPQGSLLTWSSRAQALGQEFPCPVIGLPVDDIHKRLKQVAEGYEHVVIDTPPGQLKIIRSAVLAADTVLIPVGPTMAEIDRVIPTIEIVAEVAALNEPEIWMLMTRVQRRTSISRIAREYLVNDMQMPVLETELPLWQRYATAFGLVPDDSPEYANVVRELFGEEIVETSSQAATRLRQLVEGTDAAREDPPVEPVPGEGWLEKEYEEGLDVHSESYDRFRAAAAEASKTIERAAEAHDISTAQGELVEQQREAAADPDGAPEGWTDFAAAEAQPDSVQATRVDAETAGDEDVAEAHDVSTAQGDPIAEARASDETSPAISPELEELISNLPRINFPSMYASEEARAEAQARRDRYAAMSDEEKEAEAARMRAAAARLVTERNAYGVDGSTHEEKLEELRKLLAEDEAEFGPIPQEIRDEVRRRWDAIEAGGPDEFALTPEQEAEHREVVRQVAAEHGFPLSDWQPTIPAGEPAGERTPPGRPSFAEVLVDAVLSDPAIEEEDTVHENNETQSSIRNIDAPSPRFQRETIATDGKDAHDALVGTDGPVEVASLDEAVLEQGATPDELEDGTAQEGTGDAAEVLPADVDAWRQNTPVTFNGILFETVWYDEKHEVVHAAVRDADWVVSIQTAENNGVRFDENGQVTGIDVRARNIVDGRAFITLPDPEDVAEAVREAVSETEDRGVIAGEAALERDAQALPDEVAAAEVEERLDEEDTGPLTEPNSCTEFHYWDVDWDNGTWFPEGWKYPHRCQNCGLEVLAASIDEATALAKEQH